MGANSKHEISRSRRTTAGMIMNPQRAAGMILGLTLCLCLSGCESSKARAAAVQFAFSWEQTVWDGFIWLSDVEKLEELSRKHDPVREVMKEEGPPAMWREAQQLDTLFFYVARCLDANIAANIGRREEAAARPPIPVEFPDAALNRLLGLDASAGENPKKALLALEQAITRFADAVGVGQQFQDEIDKAKEIVEKDSPAAKRLAGLSWPEIMEGRIIMARARKAARERIEEAARDADATSLSSSVAPSPSAGPESIADRKALDEVKARAQAGDPDSELELGLRYEHGEGVPRDLAEALKWYRKAAEQNYAPGQYYLGVCYANGVGVAKDPVEAAKWYRKAVEQNDVKAQDTLASCHSKGEGVKKDYAEAYKWLSLAAGQGMRTQSFI